MPWVVAVLSLGLFALIALSVFQWHTFAADTLIPAWLGDHPLPDALFQFVATITHLGDKETVVGLTLVMIAATLIARRYRLQAACLLGSGVLAAITENTLKNIFQRIRPSYAGLHLHGHHHSHHGHHADISYSFPSGHAMLSICYYGLLICFIAGELPTRYRPWLYAFGILLALIIGASRVIINVHYVSDVLAGYCIATPILLLAIVAYRYCDKKLTTH